MPTVEREKSDAYFEGGYWLDLIGFLWSPGVLVVLLATGLSARMRDRAEKLTRLRTLQSAAYWLQFTLAAWLVSLPLTVYRDYFREHHYGLSNLTFSGWMAEEAKGLAVSLVLGAVAVALLYEVVRRLRHSWIWGAAGSGSGLTIPLVITSALLV